MNKSLSIILLALFTASQAYGMEKAGSSGLGTESNVIDVPTLPFESLSSDNSLFYALPLEVQINILEKYYASVLPKVSQLARTISKSGNLAAVFEYLVTHLPGSAYSLNNFYPELAVQIFLSDIDLKSQKNLFFLLIGQLSEIHEKNYPVEFICDCLMNDGLNAKNLVLNRALKQLEKTSRDFGLVERLLAHNCPISNALDVLFGTGRIDTLPVFRKILEKAQENGISLQTDLLRKINNIFEEAQNNGTSIPEEYKDFFAKLISLLEEFGVEEDGGLFLNNLYQQIVPDFNEINLTDQKITSSHHYKSHLYLEIMNILGSKNAPIIYKPDISLETIDDKLININRTQHESLLRALCALSISKLPNVLNDPSNELNEIEFRAPYQRKLNKKEEEIIQEILTIMFALKSDKSRLYAEIERWMASPYRSIKDLIDNLIKCALANNQLDFLNGIVEILKNMKKINLL